MIDGTGAQAVVADIVIDSGRIVHIGRVSSAAAARRRVDARGKVVTPGFIDVHSHAAPGGPNENLLAMGVTTVLVGQDGQSPPGAARIGDWMRRVGASRLPINVATLAGHATLREKAGIAARDPSPQQLARLAQLIQEQIGAGAFGVSTGLEYYPGVLAKAAELEVIARAVAEHGGLIMSHLRSEDDERILASLDELIAQGRLGARVHVAHLKIVYGKGRARAEALLARMAAARESGVHLSADVYPYDASYTTVGIVFPPFAATPATFQHARLQRRGELLSGLRQTVQRRGGPEAMLFGTPPYAGKTLAEVAAEQGQPWEEVLLALGPAGASAAHFVMDDALQSRLLLDPWVMIGTDGGEQSRHPRGHGTFARVLAEYVRQRQTLPLVEAVRKMTGLPADTLGLDARGVLRPGSWADLLVFDPALVQDHATYARPHRRSTGMDWVLVNGMPAIAAGRSTGHRNGHLLRRPSATSPEDPR